VAVAVAALPPVLADREAMAAQALPSLSGLAKLI
jgi:hypothetical protein